MQYTCNYGNSFQTLGLSLIWKYIQSLWVHNKECKSINLVSFQWLLMSEWPFENDTSVYPEKIYGKH